MKVKVRHNIILVNGNAVIFADGSDVRIRWEYPGINDTRSQRLVGYANPDRAKEVVDEIWQAVTHGEGRYELPEI